MSVKPWLDRAGQFAIEHIGGIPHFSKAVDLGAPRTGVLHTTEGGWDGSLAVFRQHYAPHFLLAWIGRRAGCGSRSSSRSARSARRS